MISMQMMTRVVCLVTVLCGMAGAAAVEVRSPYCQNTLGQTSAQAALCDGAPRYFSGGSTNTAVLYLLCCLGSFNTSGFPVTIVYTPYLDSSFIRYIYDSVDTYGKENEVANFVSTCYNKVKSQGLNIDVFQCWKATGRCLC